jgi:restriction system protein
MIPDYQRLMLPLLQYAADGEEHSLRESIDALSESFHLSENDRMQLLPSGRQPVMDNRVGWARTYLAKAGLLEVTRRGHFRITDRGRDVLREKPESINVRYLERFPEFVSFRQLSRQPEGDDSKEGEESPNATPEELLEQSYEKLREALAAEILSRVMNASPAFFERLVVELLVRMGYGGSLQDAGRAIGKSGDDGIDGIIKEDRLGLDVIFVQAKRWQATVGRPEIQKFVGALQGQRAHKGVFITTSGFSADAREYASRIDSKVVLIDGPQLAQFMMDFDLGVTPVASYQVKRLDSDYFPEE